VPPEGVVLLLGVEYVPPGVVVRLGVGLLVRVGVVDVRLLGVEYVLLERTVPLVGLVRVVGVTPVRVVVPGVVDVRPGVAVPVLVRVVGELLRCSVAVRLYVARCCAVLYAPVVRLLVAVGVLAVRAGVAVVRLLVAVGVLRVPPVYTLVELARGLLLYTLEPVRGWWYTELGRWLP
jgi:hypothetical protein